MNKECEFCDGYFETALSSQDSDDVANLLRLGRRVKEYKSIAQQISRVDANVGLFIDEYILSSVHPKGLHDEVIAHSPVESGESSDSVTIEVTLDGMGMARKRLRIYYYGVICSVSTIDTPSSPLLGHDIVINGDCFQHSIYLLSAPVVRILFSGMKFEVVSS